MLYPPSDSDLAMRLPCWHFFARTVKYHLDIESDFLHIASSACLYRTQLIFALKNVGKRFTRRVG